MQFVVWVETMIAGQSVAVQRAAVVERRRHVLLGHNAGLGAALEDAHRGVGYADERSRLRSCHRLGLRNGSLYSKYGIDYADPSSHWMPRETWKVRRSGYQLEKDLPNAEHLYTDRAGAALRASLSGLWEAIGAGEVWVGRKDLYFRRDEAEEQPEGVEQAQNELYRKVGRIQLPTLLLELDSQVHFSWKLLSREPKSAEELLGIYRALL